MDGNGEIAGKRNGTGWNGTGWYVSQYVVQCWSLVWIWSGYVVDMEEIFENSIEWSEFGGVLFVAKTQFTTEYFLAI